MLILQAHFYSKLTCKKRDERAKVMDATGVKRLVHLCVPVYIVACQHLHGNQKGLKKVFSFNKNPLK